jgi:glutamate-1-semialdehyde 2,1-aminomutase
MSGSCIVRAPSSYQCGPGRAPSRQPTRVDYRIDNDSVRAADAIRAPADGTDMTTSNQQEFDRARRVLVGGVNSAVRAFRAVGGTPRFIARAQGAYMWDVEGRRYVDYLGSWGPMIVGHGHPEVLERVREAAANGLSYGAPNVMETELAERICELFPHVERVRFVSSGTEAAMSALRLARGHTGRDKIVKFEGCYHGTADSLLVKAGSGALAFGTPSSAGVPEDLARHTLVAQFNDLDSVAALFRQHPDGIACVMVEPIAGNMNLIRPAEGFHAGLRELCTRHGALLIFDEVMTGFRVALGGAQQVVGVTPDLSAFGKVIGGGMPVGAIGGPAAIMEKMAPLGPVYQAGTLSGNPIAMAAGLATLELIGRPGFFDALDRGCARLIAGLNEAARHAGVAFCAQHVGGLAGMYMLPEPPRSYAQVMTQDVERFKRFYHLMLDAGVYLPPSPVEAFFFSAAHSDADIDFTLQAASRALEAVAG